MSPQAMDRLPEFWVFIGQMKTEFERGTFNSWQDFIKPIRQWFTPERLQQVDATVMGWDKMSSYADQQTLIHLMAVLISVLRLPEFQALSSDQQNLALWIVLYHDVAKEAQHGKRDHTHGFRSAGICGKGLVRLGFVRAVDEQALAQWVTVTQNAKTFDNQHKDFIQDNTQLGDIMQGIDSLFGGRDSSAGLIICGVLFHMSLNVVDEFPQKAPLTDELICTYLSPMLMPLLRVMMLADSIAWELFSPERQIPQLKQSYREFDRVQMLLA